MRVFGGCVCSMLLPPRQVRMRTDGFMLLKNCQRPQYSGAEDIGSWQSVLAVLCTIGAITNVFLLGFTMTHLHAVLPKSHEARLLLVVLSHLV